MAFVGVGDWFQSAQWAQASVVDYSSAKIVAHGMVGGVSSVAMGGELGSGFAVSAVSQAFAISGAYEALGARENATGILQTSWNAVAAGVVGGVTSQLTGGSFESGFQTAATGRLFNDVSHRGIRSLDRAIELASMESSSLRRGVNDRSGPLTGQFTSRYRDSDIGTHIYSRRRIWFFGDREYYFLEPDTRAPKGLTQHQGLGSSAGELHKPGTSEALVIAAKPVAHPRLDTPAIRDRASSFMDLSIRVQSPVYVAPNSGNKLYRFDSSGCTLQRGGSGPCF